MELPEGHSIVTISYGHAFLDDFTSYSASTWPKTLTSPAVGFTDSTTSVACINHYFLRLRGKFTEITDEKFYVERNIINRNTKDYPKYRIRYRTGDDSVQGLLKFMFTVGQSPASQEVTLPSSTAWTVLSGTITSNKTVDKIQLWLDDNPNSQSDDRWHSVDVDFIMVYKGDFTIPNFRYGYTFRPPARYASLVVPSRVGDVTQNLGSPSATVTFGCDLDELTEDEWKRDGDVVDGEVFLDILHNSSSEPWQWLDDDPRQFKVTLEDPRFEEVHEGTKVNHRFHGVWREYREGDAENETYLERFGLNL